MVLCTRLSSKGERFLQPQIVTASYYVIPRFRGIPDEINPVIVGHYRVVFESKLEGYERILSRQKYIAGDVRHLMLVCDRVKLTSLQEFSLADIFHLFYGALLKEAGFDYLESGRYPSITRSEV